MKSQIRLFNMPDVTSIPQIPIYWHCDANKYRVPEMHLPDTPKHLQNYSIATEEYLTCFVPRYYFSWQA